MTIPSELEVHPHLVRKYMRRIADSLQDWADHEACEASSIEAHKRAAAILRRALEPEASGGGEEPHE